MRRYLSLLLLLTIVTPSRAGTMVFVSSPKDKEIIAYRFDESSAKLTELARTPAGGEPAALTTSPDGRFLFASLRPEGRLTSFRLEPSTGKLRKLSDVDAGADPAHIRLDPTGRFLFTAYYIAAKVSVHAVDADGKLSEKPLQEVPTTEKAHAAGLDPSGRYLFVPHTAPNRIEQLIWDPKTARLRHNDPPRLHRPENTGPRHVAWHLSKPVAYIDNEQGSSVTSYRLDEASGRLTPLATVTTLPPSSQGSNSTSELKVHPDGKSLYVANRGHDSLAIYRIAPDGETLTPAGHLPTEANPRSFDITPSGKFLISAGENSGHMAIYDLRDGATTPKLLERRDVSPRLWWVHIVDLP